MAVSRSDANSRRSACIDLTVAFRRRPLIVEMAGPILGRGSSVGLVNTVESPRTVAGCNHAAYSPPRHRPGRSIIQTMDSTRTEAFNLRGGGGAPTAHKRLLAYLEWAGRAARMLSGRISGKDLASLVLNRRNELLLASAGTLTSSDVEVQRVVNDLVSQELDQRVDDFDEAIKTLKAYKLTF